MSEGLLQRFKKIPEQLKGATRQELNQTIDSAKHIADEHAKVANRYEDQADKIEVERRTLEAELNGMGIKQLSPAGYRLQGKIRELKKQEEDKRTLAEGYHDQEFYERTRASEANVKKKERESRYEKPERTADQVDRDITAEAKRRSQTTFGKIIALNDKLGKTTDPQEREKLEKEIAEYRDVWQKESDVKVSNYKPIKKPTNPTPEKTHEPKQTLKATPEPQPATEKTIDTEPRKIKPGDMVVTWNQEPKPSTEVEERKQILLDLRDKTNESKPGRPKQLSLTPHMPPPNIQPEKATPEKVVEPKFANGIEKEIRNKKEESRQNLEATTKPNQERDDSVSKPFKDFRDSKVVKDKDPSHENTQKYVENKRVWHEYIQDKLHKNDRDPERDPERDPDRGPDRSPKR